MESIDDGSTNLPVDQLLLIQSHATESCPYVLHVTVFSEMSCSYSLLKNSWVSFSPPQCDSKKKAAGRRPKTGEGLWPEGAGGQQGWLLLAPPGCSYELCPGLKLCPGFCQVNLVNQLHLRVPTPCLKIILSLGNVV